MRTPIREKVSDISSPPRGRHSHTNLGFESDSPIILDYSRIPSDPPVLRLRWAPLGQGNQWVQGARDFDELAQLLGLAAGIE